MIGRFLEFNRKLSLRYMKAHPRPIEVESYTTELMRRIDDTLLNEPGDVLEAGGFDQPMLQKDQGYVYDGLDISDAETCHHIYDTFWVASIEQPLPRSYRMILSSTLLEHVRDNESAMRTIFNALIPGGVTHHYVPSAQHPYSICLKIVGPNLQKTLIPYVRPDRTSCYPAYFDFCTPKSMQRLLSRLGFIDIDIKPYYCARHYFSFFAPAYVLVSLFEDFCRRHGWSAFASGFVFSARKPPSPASVKQG